jgi:pyroglutamyl-peptidase
MSRVLITAFGPYGSWVENSSWLALVELTRRLPSHPAITTRLYPVDFAAVSERLSQDLQGHDYSLHLGQAPGATCIQLEAIGINVGAASIQETDQPKPLVADGPVAYRSQLPLGSWAELLRQAGIPARVSYHAGTYLCNATLYYAQHLCAIHGWNTKSAFLHLPLTIPQSIRGARDEPLPAMPSSVAADAIRLILDQITDEARP